MDFEGNQDEQIMAHSIFSIWWPFYTQKTKTLKKGENSKKN